MFIFTENRECLTHALRTLESHSDSEIRHSYEFGFRFAKSVLCIMYNVAVTQAKA